MKDRLLKVGLDLIFSKIYIVLCLAAVLTFLSGWIKTGIALAILGLILLAAERFLINWALGSFMKNLLEREGHF